MKLWGNECVELIGRQVHVTDMSADSVWLIDSRLLDPVSVLESFLENETMKNVCSKLDFNRPKYEMG